MRDEKITTEKVTNNQWKEADGEISESSSIVGTGEYVFPNVVTILLPASYVR